jgi:hypothetical protein
MTCRRSTRNPVRVRAVQFYSRLVGTYGCGQVRHDSGRVRPARFLACGRSTTQIGTENSAGCGSGSMFESECHALVLGLDLPGRSGPSTYTWVKFDRRNVRASHGLAGVMQIFYKRFWCVEPALFFGCQQILSADLFFVSRFCEQIFLVNRFTFCQQVLSAYFYSQQFQFLSEDCLMFRPMERHH